MTGRPDKSGTRVLFSGVDEGGQVLWTNDREVSVGSDGIIMTLSGYYCQLSFTVLKRARERQKQKDGKLCWIRVFWSFHEYLGYRQLLNM